MDQLDHWHHGINAKISTERISNTIHHVTCHCWQYKLLTTIVNVSKRLLSFPLMSTCITRSLYDIDAHWKIPVEVVLLQNLKLFTFLLFPHLKSNSYINSVAKQSRTMKVLYHYKTKNRWKYF